ncbi:Reverse transcriptase zinc-binding domain [Macleaya cordata]|uniref:Reverse transcriptase zinc-binding domain n=1 Tax=Macleaya cordata TaxID=56857 RepID=A0A200QA65_MACCD|nr:Reverse transcriptase zinc-binding domain [Macleaya cordata]
MDLGFRRQFIDWEQEDLGRLMMKLNSLNLSLDSADSLSWIPAKDKLFSVQSCYKLLLPSQEGSFPAASVWGTLAPTKVSFIVWAAYLRKLPTVDTLRRKRRVVPDRCELCSMDEKTCDDLMM